MHQKKAFSRILQPTQPSLPATTSKMEACVNNFCEHRSNEANTMHQKNQAIEGHMHNNQEYSKEHQHHNYEYDKSKSDHIQTLNCIYDLKKDIQKLTQIVTANQVPMKKEYYSVKEVAKIIERAEFTVREYCNRKRIIAEKKDSGRGSSNEWKISYEELNHYLNHGLRSS
jgi:Helix-turn-helix domain